MTRETLKEATEGKTDIIKELAEGCDSPERGLTKAKYKISVIGELLDNYRQQDEPEPFNPCNGFRSVALIPLKRTETPLLCSC